MISVGDAASRAGVAEGALLGWETGQARPTLPQLRRLARIYRRPLAFFYLPDAPPRSDALHDFRRGGHSLPVEPSPELTQEIRCAGRRRELMIELSNSLQEEVPLFRLQAQLGDDPEHIGAQLRLALNCSVSAPRGAGDYAALRAWRGAVEAQGVLVFQASSISLGEMLGFSLFESPLPIIGLNVKQPPRARVFTLLHELAHLMIRVGNVCNPAAEDWDSTQDVEVFCNRVAGATLVPMELIRERSSGVRAPAGLVAELAREWRLGREVVARRMLAAGVIDGREFAEMRPTFTGEYRTPSGGSGGPPPHLRVLHGAGYPFARRVMAAYREDLLTVNDVVDCLELRPDHFRALETAIEDYSDLLDEEA